MLSTQNQQRKAAATGAFLALVWAIGAALQPTSTYHLAPLLVAGSVPGVAGAANGADLFRATTSGILLALLTAFILSTINLLRGPSLLPHGGAFAEAVTFTVVGALGGALLAALTGSNRSESAA